MFLGTATSRIINYENDEILTSNLRKIKSIVPDYFDKTESVEKILSSACKELNGLPECLTELSKVFGVPEGQKIEKLNEFKSFIFRRDLSIDEIVEADSESQEKFAKAKRNETNALGLNDLKIEQDSQEKKTESVSFKLQIFTNLLIESSEKNFAIGPLPISLFLLFSNTI